MEPLTWFDLGITAANAIIQRCEMWNYGSHKKNVFLIVTITILETIWAWRNGNIFSLARRDIDRLTARLRAAIGERTGVTHA